jgi:hypothetical protein
MEHPDIDAVFTELTSGLTVPQDISREFKQKGPKTLVSIDRVKNHLLQCLVDQLIPLKSEQYENMEMLVEQLNQNLQRDLEHIGELSSGDTVVSTGDSVIMLVDEDDGSFGLIGIKNKQQVRGIFETVVATQIPTPQAISLMQNPEDDQHGKTPIDITENPGVTLLVLDAVIIDQDGSEIPVDSKFTVLIPLNYPNLQLGKLI